MRGDDRQPRAMFSYVSADARIVTLETQLDAEQRALAGDRRASRLPRG